MKVKAHLFLVVILIAAGAWMLGGCGGTSGGNGRLQVLLADNPLDADEINIFIKSVDVHKDGGGWFTVRSWDTPLKVNLLEHTPDKPLLLAEAPLGTGHYTQIRLMLDSAEIVRSGQTYSVDLRNVNQTGIKCIGPFTVNEGELCAIIVDFNAGRSFVENPPGSGNFMLQPTLSMSPVNIATKVTGQVVVKDSSDTSKPIPEDAVIYVYTPGHIGEQLFLIATADIDPLETDPLIGVFRIPIIPQGTYDLRIMFGSTIVKDITGQAFTAPETNLGTITLVIP